MGLVSILGRSFLKVVELLQRDGAPSPFYFGIALSENLSVRGLGIPRADFDLRCVVG